MFSFNSYVYYLSRGFELITREFGLVTRGFKLVTHEFELVTHVLLLHQGSKQKELQLTIDINNKRFMGINFVLL